MSLTELTAPTISEADAYIEGYYSIINPVRVRWSILEGAEKTGYINRSFAEFESLTFKEYTPFDKVLNAISENAFAILNKDISALSDMQFKTLQSAGERKNTKYNRREQGDIVGINTAPTTPVNVSPLTSARAYAMIRLFVGGSFPIL